MAKPAKRSSKSSTSKSTVDKLAKAAMSKEMLAAGLTAAAAAIAASPKARKAIREAGLDAADTASNAASSMAIDFHHSRCRLQKPHQDVDQGCLAAARFSRDPDAFAALDRQRDIVQRASPAGIVETD